MATFSRELLSGSTDGMPIKVTGTNTAGAVTIHTAHASAKDEVYLWVSNTSASAATLTLEWGGATDPDNLLCKAVSIPANSPPIPISTGQTLTNSKVVEAFAGTANVLNIVGYVNRIT